MRMTKLVWFIGIVEIQAFFARKKTKTKLRLQQAQGHFEQIKLSVL